MQAVFSRATVLIVLIGSSLMTIFWSAGRNIPPMLSKALVGVVGVAPGTGSASWSAVSLCVMPTWLFTHLKTTFICFSFFRARNQASSRAQAVLTLDLAVAWFFMNILCSFMIALLLSERISIVHLLGDAHSAIKNPHSSALKEEAGPMGNVHLRDTSNVGL